MPERVGDSDPVQALHDVAVLWEFGTVRAGSVIRAACDVVAADIGGDDMLMLAARSIREPVGTFEFSAAARSALLEVGRDLPALGSRELAELAVRAMARRTVQGEVTGRDLASWAHRHLGHGGIGIAQRLVELDDAYDLADGGVTADHEADLDAAALAEAHALASS